MIYSFIIYYMVLLLFTCQIILFIYCWQCFNMEKVCHLLVKMPIIEEQPYCVSIQSVKKQQQSDMLTGWGRESLFQQQNMVILQ